MSQLILASKKPPGDAVALTATAFSLARQYPEYQISVRTKHPDIWLHNPDIVTPSKDARVINMDYPSISVANDLPLSYLGGYTEYLAEQLDIPLELATNRPHLYTLPEEELDLKPNFFLISAGYSKKLNLKYYPHWQAVIDMLPHINFVQIGSNMDWQPNLNNVVNIVGKTTLRQLILLAKKAIGGVGNSTLLQHIMAAWQKPYVCLLGGREAMPWQASYPTQHTLHTIGLLDCCKTGGCWIKRLRDCKQPDWQNNSGTCMSMLQPQEVAATIDRLVKIAPRPDTLDR